MVKFQWIISLELAFIQSIPPQMTRTMPAPAPTTAASPSEAFPALSGPAPTAIAKLNRDWTAVPVKHKKTDPGKAASSHNSSKPPPSSRWDLPEEEAPNSTADRAPRKFYQEPSSSSPSPRTANGPEVRWLSCNEANNVQNYLNPWLSLSKPDWIRWFWI